jgi:HEPN domain-containing protein
VPDVVCFLFQQCSEKYLKGLLEENGLTVPRTHVPIDLLTLLRPYHPSLGAFRRGLDFLTRFAVQVRYRGFNAKKQQAAAARRWADRVRTAARTILGLPLHPPRRKK